MSLLVLQRRRCKDVCNTDAGAELACQERCKSGRGQAVTTGVEEALGRVAGRLPACLDPGSRDSVERCVTCEALARRPLRQLQQADTVDLEIGCLREGGQLMQR